MRRGSSLTAPYALGEPGTRIIGFMPGDLVVGVHLPDQGLALDDQEVTEQMGMIGGTGVDAGCFVAASS